MSTDFFWETDAQHRLLQMVHGPNYPAAYMGRGIIGRTAWEVPSLSPDDAGWAAHRATLEQHLPFRDFEFARSMPDGVQRYFSISGQPRHSPDGLFSGYRGVGRDITEIAVARERIASLAYSDPLTGLANRTSLGPSLEQAVRRPQEPGCVCSSTDGFVINDVHGHDTATRCRSSQLSACAPTRGRATVAWAATNSSWCSRKSPRLRRWKPWRASC
jgi:hypothetical protein